MKVRFKFKSFVFVFSWIALPTSISIVSESSWVGWPIFRRAITSTTPGSVGTNGRKRRRKTAGTHVEKKDLTKEARNQNKKKERTGRGFQRNARQDQKRWSRKGSGEIWRRKILGDSRSQTALLKQLTLCCIVTNYTIPDKQKLI